MMFIKLKGLIRRYRITLLTFLILFICCIYEKGYTPFTLNRLNFSTLLWVLANVSIITSILYFVSRIPKIRIIFVLLLSLLFSIEMTHLLVFGSRIMFGGIASMFETNSIEVIAMASQLWFWFIPIFLIISCLFVLVCRELANCRLSLRLSSMFLFFFMILLPLIVVLKERRESERSKVAFDEYPFFFIQERTGVKLPFIYGTFVTSIAYFIEVNKFSEYVQIERVLPDGVEFVGKEYTPQTVYILVGESSLRTHYSLYDYNIPTTPWLDSMKRRHNLFFYEGFSPAAITRDALKMSLSFAVPTNQQSFFKNFNAVELANLAGYETYWISNQDKIGMNDSYIGFIASSSNHSEFHNYKKDDLDLISIAESLYDSKKHQVFFIHLKGSHILYGDKSDEEDKVIV